MNTSLLLILADAGPELYVFFMVSFVLWAIYGIVRVVLKIKNGVWFSAFTVFLALLVILAALVPSKSTLILILEDNNSVEISEHITIEPLTENGKLSNFDEIAVYQIPTESESTYVPPLPNIIPPEKPKSTFIMPPKKPNIEKIPTESIDPIDFEREVYGELTLDFDYYKSKTPNGIIAKNALLPNNKKPPG